MNMNMSYSVLTSFDRAVCVSIFPFLCSVFLISLWSTSVTDVCVSDHGIWLFLMNILLSENDFFQWLHLSFCRLEDTYHCSCSLCSFCIFPAVIHFPKLVVNMCCYVTTYLPLGLLYTDEEHDCSVETQMLSDLVQQLLNYYHSSVICGESEWCGFLKGDSDTSRLRLPLRLVILSIFHIVNCSHENTSANSSIALGDMPVYYPYSVSSNVSSIEQKY